jgi:fido (protein-threonine AMPylation protein)
LPDWDRDSPQLAANLRAVQAWTKAHAESRERLSPQIIKQWHGEIMEGLDVPHSAYVGHFRGEESLERVAVRVRECWGSPPDEVDADVARMLDALEAGLAVLDEAIPPGRPPGSADELDAVLELAALMHARWVAIHPFANGNGRTARLLANWIALRYGVPAFVRLRPRPDDAGYAQASRRALCDHEYAPTVVVFRAMYDHHIGRTP